MIEQLGEPGFARVRFGVGKPGPQAGTADGGAKVARAAGISPGDKDVAGWVLADFPSSQASIVRAMVDASVEAVQAITGDGIAKAMNQLNGRPTFAGPTSGTKGRPTSGLSGSSPSTGSAGSANANTNTNANAKGPRSGSA
jgi:hypothetical protein